MLDRSQPDVEEREREEQSIANKIMEATTNNPHIAEDRHLDWADGTGSNEEDKYDSVVRVAHVYAPPGPRKQQGAVGAPSPAKTDIPKISVNARDVSAVQSAQSGATPPKTTSTVPTVSVANKPPVDPEPAFRQFKLNKPIPEDLVPILAKSKETLQQIREKSARDAASSQAHAIGTSAASVVSPSPSTRIQQPSFAQTPKLTSVKTSAVAGGSSAKDSILASSLANVASALTFKHNKAAEESSVSTLWPYNGKSDKLMFPPITVPGQQQPPHISPPPGPPRTPPQSYGAVGVDVCARSKRDDASPPAPAATVRTRVPLQDPPWWGRLPKTISPEIASLKCKYLGVDGVLGRLNQAVAKRLKREVLMSDPGVKALLERLLVDGDELFDFGALYARIRILFDRKMGYSPEVDVNEMYSKRIEFVDGPHRICNISWKVSDLECSELGVRGVLRQLNKALRGRRRKIQMSDPGVEPLLKRLVQEYEWFGDLYDRVCIIFHPGMGYSRLRDVNRQYSEWMEFVACHHLRNIIPPEVASLKCKDLGVEGVLRRLNQALAGDFEQEILMSDPGVESLLERLVNGEDIDFGTLYVRVRNLWDYWVHKYGLRDVDRLYSKLIEVGDHLDAAKNACVTDDLIDQSSDRRVSSWARRLWDLRAHRVIPYHFSFCCMGDFGVYRSGSYHAVSHSWTDTMSEGSGIVTDVNGREWLVPLPTGVTLEAVRNELLNLGAEYAWLDVVCLRQHSDSHASESIRVNEWKVDIPTIGTIYENAARVIRYYNGLGVPFECRGWSGPRHWLRRVWTIQEIKDNSIPAGLPEGLEAGDLMKQKSLEDGRTLEDHLQPIMKLEKYLKYPEVDMLAVLKVATELKGRFATNPIDKIAAFGALVTKSRIPLYKGDMDLEDAWDLLVQHMPGEILEGFLWQICVPGKGRYRWIPSWAQLMCEDFDVLLSRAWFLRDVEVQLLSNNFICEPDCQLLTGHAQLTWAPTDDQRLRGKVHYSDSVVRELEFSIYASTGQECRDGTIRLVGYWFYYLMVCKQVEIAAGQVGYEKISVVLVKDIGFSTCQAEYQTVDAVFV